MSDIEARMIQLVGTTDDWAANDIVLREGEFGLEKDGNSYKVKIGDGVAPWSLLPYFGGGSGGGGGGPVLPPMTTLDLTDAPPANPVEGYLFLASTAGVIAPSFGAIAGEAVAVGEAFGYLGGAFKRLVSPHTPPVGTMVAKRADITAPPTASPSEGDVVVAEADGLVNGGYGLGSSAAMRANESLIYSGGAWRRLYEPVPVNPAALRRDMVTLNAPTTLVEGQLIYNSGTGDAHPTYNLPAATKVSVDDVYLYTNGIWVRVFNKNAFLPLTGGTITGDLVVEGNTTIGNADTDKVIITAKLGSSLVPDVADTYTLGADGMGFLEIYSEALYVIDNMYFNYGATGSFAHWDSVPAGPLYFPTRSQTAGVGMGAADMSGVLLLTGPLNLAGYNASFIKPTATFTLINITAAPIVINAPAANGQAFICGELNPFTSITLAPNSVVTALYPGDNKIILIGGGIS